MKFTELEINEQLLQGIEAMGFVDMSEIQEQAIPKLMMGGDLIGKSQTGTGKTVAFAIPAITKLDPTIKKVQVLVLCPTRELAVQVSDEFKKVLKFQKGVKVLPIYGGASIEAQLRDLKSGVQIVVGTPGRVMDHMRRKTLKLNDISMVILDEADEMLNMGFREDIELILDEIAHDIQTALFSATMPKPILKIAEKYLKNPTLIEISPKNMVAPGIEQKYFNISDHNKFEALTRLLEVYKPKRSLIFCNTKKYVDDITDDLKKLGYSVDKIHGDMRQMSRMAVLKQFSRGQIEILVATDVAARGIDVDDVDIVFNYDVPDNEEYYVHRIGRTGRAGKSGISLTLARSRDQFRLKKITDYTKKSIERGLIPTSEVINDIKIAHFHERFTIRAEKGNGNKGTLDVYVKIVEDLKEKGYTPETIAAVLLQSQLPLSEAEDLNAVERRPRRSDSSPRRDGRDSRDGRVRREGGSREGGSHRSGPEKTKRLFISVGEKDKAQKRDILGAICGECGISSSSVGNIDMYDKFTFVDVDEELAKKVEKKLNGKIIKDRKVKVEISKKKK
ncbi:DEAD/DEAH box helicase [Acetobacterium paludosum]|uniref:DEAD/DEAH box helicase n=1 Tax=Acetobacterium paludosum TaxID=52693 RepID=A0A923HTG4_9FIRM|nr:DEAD/DEAH box helicase [Acetobacterium paludosum]MBC3886887.1 DEAD/DEAH box helicase [Acetobacterium paludosum]